MENAQENTPTQAPARKRTRADTPPGQPTRIPFQFQARRPAFRPTFTSVTESLDAALACLVHAANLAENAEKQKSLLELTTVFREYTEHGKLDYSKSILTAHVHQLESISRNLANKVRDIHRPPALDNTRPGNPSYAAVAATNSKQPQPDGFSTVKGKKNQRETRQDQPRDQKSSVKARQIVLSTSAPIDAFSALALRNALNDEFRSQGIRGPVISTVSLTLRKNVLITDTEDFSAKFLLEKQSTIRKIFPDSRMQANEPWYRVACHGVPLTDTRDLDISAFVKEEISTFNPGLKVVGEPYWLTPADKRATQRAGSLVIAFATEQEAKRAISNRLRIAGVSVKVEKLLAVPRSTQCLNCQGFGHLDTHCRLDSRCALCAEPHHTRLHSCSQCPSRRGRRCVHTPVTCANCARDHLLRSRPLQEMEMQEAGE